MLKLSNRVFVIMIFVVLLLGSVAGGFLHKQEDPSIPRRYGFVLSEYAGANAETVERDITVPIERVLLGVPEVDAVSSTSRAGVSRTEFDFDDTLSPSQLEGAWAKLDQELQAAASSFPSNAARPRLNRKYVSAEAIVVSLSWSSSTNWEASIAEKLSEKIAADIQRVPFTARVTRFGAPRQEVNVVLRSDFYSAAGINAKSVVDAIRGAQIGRPLGQLDDGETQTTYQSGQTIGSLSELKEVSVQLTPSSRPVELMSIADISIEQKSPPDSVAMVDGSPSILISAQIDEGADIGIWTRSVDAEITRINRELPDGFEAKVVFAQDVYVVRNISGLFVTFLFVLCSIVIILSVVFDPRSAAVIVLSLPLSLSLVLVSLLVFGFALEQMTLTGILVSVGLLVDNAIVVVDRIDAEMKKRGNLKSAVRLGPSGVTAPLLLSSLTTCAAFAPVLLIQGSTGEFLGGLGASVILCISISFATSLFVIPRLYLLFHELTANRIVLFYLRLSDVSRTISRSFKTMIVQLNSHKGLSLGLVLLPSALGLFVIQYAPVQFFPPSDRSQAQVVLRLGPGDGINKTREIVQEISKGLSEVEHVQQQVWVAGTSPPRIYYNAFTNADRNPNFAGGWIQFNERVDLPTLLPKLQMYFRERYPTAEVLILPFEQGPSTQAPIEVFVAGADLRVLDQIGREIRTKLASVPGVTYTNASISIGLPQIEISYDESVLASAGATTEQIDLLLRSAIRGEPVGYVHIGERPTAIIVRAPHAVLGSHQDFMSLAIDFGTTTIPLNAFGESSIASVPSQITRRNGERVNFVRAQLVPFLLPSEPFSEFRALLDSTQVTVPVGYSTSFGGEAEERSDSTSRIVRTFAVVVLLIFLALYVVYASFKSVAIIVVSGFLSIGYGLLALALFGQPFGFTAVVGLAGLFGVSINGAMIVISAMRQAQDKANLIEVTMSSSRHLFTTAVTTIAGFIPVMLTGNAFWLPLCVVISGGVVGSLALSLVAVPILEGTEAKISRSRTAE